jgi:hypothetical protein
MRWQVLGRARVVGVARDWWAGPVCCCRCSLRTAYARAAVLLLLPSQVLLPTSKTIMDRAQIVRHLLSSQHDPFNRAALTPDELIPQPELKARIEAWVAAAVAAKRSKMDVEQ